MAQTRAGQLTERITIEAPVLADDGHGGEDITRWDTKLDRIPAAVKRVRATEGEERGREQNTKIYMFTVRRREGVLEQWRINWRDELYNIRQVHLPPKVEQFMTIIAQSGVAP